MQFKVPQFLDIEDKIFGPFTFSQFAYLAGGAGLCFIIYKLLGFLLGFIPMVAMAAFALALTFYRPNGKPFIFMIQAWLKYLSQNKLYIWKKENKKKDLNKQKIEVAENTTTSAKLTGSKLQDLAWSLDVLDTKEKEVLK